MEMIKKIFYPVVIEECNDEDGHYFVASSPNIKGMVTDGDTFEEAAINAEDAISTVIEGEKNIPQPEDPFNWKLKPNERLVYIPVDVSKYLQKYSKMVRKSITVPEYLSDWAKENKVNVSRVASDALRGLQEQQV